MKKKTVIIKYLLVSVSWVTGAYFLFTLYTSHQYISSLISSNKIVVSQQLNQIISYYMNNSLPYLVYTVLLVGLSVVVSYQLNKVQTILDSQETQVDEDEEENEINEFFKELANQSSHD